jgi:hypothetical protein
VSSKGTREWLYVFLPRADSETLYIKVLIRSECAITSFHHEQVDDEEQDIEP